MYWGRVLRVTINASGWRLRIFSGTLEFSRLSLSVQTSQFSLHFCRNFALNELWSCVVIWLVPGPVQLNWVLARTLAGVRLLSTYLLTYLLTYFGMRVMSLRPRCDAYQDILPRFLTDPDTKGLWSFFFFLFFFSFFLLSLKKWLGMIYNIIASPTEASQKDIIFKRR